MSTPSDALFPSAEPDVAADQEAEPDALTPQTIGNMKPAVVASIGNMKPAGGDGEAAPPDNAVG